MQIVVGTVGLALLALIGLRLYMRYVKRVLPELPDDSLDLLALRPSGYVATYTRGDHDRALLQVQQDLARCVAERRREATALRIHRAVRFGEVTQIEPLEGDSIPSAVPVTRDVA